MDPSAPRTRHLADRARLQPAGRRAAGRLRPAAILLILAACGSERAAEDFRGRFVEMRWEEVGAWEPQELVRGLQAYVDGNDPIFPRDGPQAKQLHEFLFLQRPDPRALAPLFGAHDETDEVTERLQKRDLVAYCVITSFIRRLWEDPRERFRAALYDAITDAGIHFAFDPVYGDAHTHTGAEVGDFFTDPGFPVCEESTRSLRRTLSRYLEQWRGRVTDRASSTFFGIVLRHLGEEGARALAAEWEGMNENERVDLLKRMVHEDSAPKAVRERMIGGLLDPSLEVRRAAAEALEAHGAPLGELDGSARESDVRRALPRLERWAAETES